MFFEGLQSYYAPLSTLIIFTVMILADKLFSKRIKRLFLLECAVIFVIIAATWADRCLSVIGGDVAWRVRFVTTFLNFAISPISPMLLVMIYHKQHIGGRKWLLFAPVIVNFMLCVASFWTGWICAVSSDNVYTRGPLFAVPFVVSAFYFCAMVVYSIRQDKPNRRVETTLLLAILCAIGAASVLEVIFVVRFMLWSTTEICVILYFLLLSTQKIMYDPLTGAFSRMAYTKRLEKIDGRQCCTIAMIDVNGLKWFNDEHGHHVGDTALAQVGAAILKCKQRSMRLYRFGGDEFVLLGKGCCTGAVRQTLNGAQAYCGTVEGKDLTFAYGVAEYYPGMNLHETTLEADADMYKNKQQMKED